MSKEALRSAMSDNVVSGKESPGGSMINYEMGKPVPNLDSAMSSLGFPAIDTSGIGLDIPGGLMTTFSPQEDGSGKLDSSFGTKPVSD